MLATISSPCGSHAKNPWSIGLLPQMQIHDSGFPASREMCSLAMLVLIKPLVPDHTSLPIRVKCGATVSGKENVARVRCRRHFRARKKTGPVTLNGEYVSIIRMRSLVRLISGFSSALKTVGGATPNSRAASTFDLPAFSRNFFANAASSVSCNIRSVFISQNETENIHFSYFFLELCP